jgi:hypothetical protein
MLPTRSTPNALSSASLILIAFRKGSFVRRRARARARRRSSMKHPQLEVRFSLRLVPFIIFRAPHSHMQCHWWCPDLSVPSALTTRNFPNFWPLKSENRQAKSPSRAALCAGVTFIRKISSARAVATFDNKNRRNAAILSAAHLPAGDFDNGHTIGKALLARFGDAWPIQFWFSSTFVSPRLYVSRIFRGLDKKRTHAWATLTDRIGR